MKEYHFTFKINKEDTHSLHHREEASNEYQALKQFRQKYPLAHFMAMIDSAERGWVVNEEEFSTEKSEN